MLPVKCRNKKIEKTMERISLLSLSLMLISSFSITAGLPAMVPYFSHFGYTASQVELLVSPASLWSWPCFFLNSLIERWMSERQMIVGGSCSFQLVASCLWLCRTILSSFWVVCSLAWGQEWSNARLFRLSVSATQAMIDPDAGLSGVCWSGGLCHLDLYCGTTLTPRLAWSCLYVWWLLDFTLYILWFPILGAKRIAWREKRKVRTPSLPHWCFVNASCDCWYHHLLQFYY